MAHKDELKKTKGEPRGLRRFWRETTGELKKVTWPTRQEATNLTFVVLIVMFAMSAFLWLVDLGASELLKLGVGS
ncbi:MAG: preprotein translocase subunit SecE [Chloroflexi bacterium]|nr:preprotein translocase subunit SecE [Chloroflexota bacterium]